MAAHAELSPSSAERWMTCPASVPLSRDLEDSGSADAEEGTAAHFLAEHCLTTGGHPSEYIGRQIIVSQDGVKWLNDIDTQEEADHPRVSVSVDFAAHVNNYVQFIRELVKGTGGTLLVEQRMDISFLTGESEAEGTSDAVILTPDELIVVDLKFGRGVEVEAENNKQLMIYALAAYRKFEMLGDFKTVRVIIHQPRVSGPKEWDLSVEQLLEFGLEVSQAATRARTIDIQLEGRAAFSVSDKGCRWCKVKNTRRGCPALDAHIENAIGADFEDLTAVERQIDLLDVVEPDTLSKKMAASDLVEQWIKAVRGAVEHELLAGRPVENYKLVQGKQGNRQWINAEEAEKLLKGMKIKEADMYDRTVITPTSAEKLKKAGTIGPRQWPKVEAEITRAKGKPSVAHISDKREALVLDKPEDDFEVVEDRPSLI